MLPFTLQRMLKHIWSLCFKKYDHFQWNRIVGNFTVPEKRSEPLQEMVEVLLRGCSRKEQKHCLLMHACHLIYWTCQLTHQLMGRNDKYEPLIGFALHNYNLWLIS